MAMAVGWNQRNRVRYQPVLDDGVGLYRVRNRDGILWRPIWRLRLAVPELADELVEVQPITFRSRARALRLATAFEELQEFKALDVVAMAEDLLDGDPSER